MSFTVRMRGVVQAEAVIMSAFLESELKRAYGYESIFSTVELWQDQTVYWQASFQERQETFRRSSQPAQYSCAFVDVLNS